jgi:hypothetical protein
MATQKDAIIRVKVQVSSNVTIAEDAVEAAAMAAYEFRFSGLKAWDDLSEHEQSEAIAEQEFALEAAMPHMLRAVAEDARPDLYEIISHSFYNEFEDPSGHTADAIIAAGYRKVSK